MDNINKIPEISTFIFDLGGVLMDWDPRYYYSKLSGDGAKIEFFLANVCSPDWNMELDRGKSFDISIDERIQKFPEWTDWIRDWKTQWGQMLRGTVPGTYEILKKIKEAKTFRLLALSNWSAETFPLAYSRYPELEIFDDILISGKEKMVKPNADFFNFLCEKHGLKSEDCLFIDDLKKNIIAAAQLGYNVHHFSSASLLEPLVLGILGRNL